jgi:hypothetical protein
MKTRAITHVAMSVPVGSLSPDRRSEILEFYGEVFGWREMHGVSNNERLALWVGPDCYINVRERNDHAALSYEHFGVLVESEEAVNELWARVTERGANAGSVGREAGVPMFKFQHLLPMAIEVQCFPEP